MTVIFQDGFETGNFSSWTSAGAKFSVVSSPVHSGSYSALSSDPTGTWGPLIKSLTAPTVLFVRAYIQIPNGLIAVSHQLISFLGPNFENIALLQIVHWGGQYWWGCACGDPAGIDGGLVYGSNALAFVLDPTHWYCIELECQLGATGYVKVYADGVQVDTASGNNAAYGAISSVALNGWASGPINVIFDDVVMSDAYIGTGTVTPPALAVSVAPMSSNIQVGSTVGLIATSTGGTAPHTITWLDGVSNAVLGSGSTLTYMASQAGVFTVYARVTDGAGSTVESADATITASTTVPPRVKSGAGTYYLLPAPMLHKLWVLREKYIGKKMHKKLHPLI
jgi:hypothetical protein